MHDVMLENRAHWLVESVPGQFAHGMVASKLFSFNMQWLGKCPRIFYLFFCVETFWVKSTAIGGNRVE